MGTTFESAVEIRPAATVILVRDGDQGAEVLMVRRNRDSVFLGGAHVFPGGAVDDVDDSAAAHQAIRWNGPSGEFAWRAAALRELGEEAGILLGSELDATGLHGAELYEALAAADSPLDADGLEYFANWVTPAGPPRRFDTRFYAAIAAGTVVTDDREVFDAVWVRPEDALEASDRGDWFLEFPTRVTLAGFAGNPDAAAFLEQARRMEVRRIAPRIGVGSDGTQRILMEGDPGFDEAPA